MNKIEEQIRKGKQAQVLLQDPILKTAFEDLLETYRQEIFNTSFADDDTRRNLWVAFNMVDKIKGHLLSVMSSGRLAQADIEQLNKRS